jgi:hypothetical protein
MCDKNQGHPTKIMPVFITALIMPKNRHNNWHNSGNKMAVNHNKDTVYRAAKAEVKDRMISANSDEYIFLNESIAENTSLLDYGTIYDYDCADHLFKNE